MISNFVVDRVQGMIGDSESIKEIKMSLLRIAATDSTVLITGETGTGKELAAGIIHKNSPQSKMPFICINCAAIPDSLLESELFGYERGAFTGAIVSKAGKFEQANGGTIFLDEIGDMNQYAQAKVLRAIEMKEVYRLGGKSDIPLHIRIIAATNKDPEQMIHEGRFRKDLFYRLNIARIHLPPLRDRKEDILDLIEYCIRKLNRRFGRDVEGLSEEALTYLINYEWPGNVRELKNMMEAIFINLPSHNTPIIDLPKNFMKHIKKTDGLFNTEKEKMLSTLFATRWNKTKAAQKLNWSRMTLYRKMAQYDITRIPCQKN